MLQLPVVNGTGQDPFAVLGCQLRQRGGNRRLAHATFPGDEHETPFEESRRLRAPVDRRDRPHWALGAQWAPKPTLRSASGAPIST